jgi:hypothetical protein
MQNIAVASANSENKLGIERLTSVLVDAIIVGQELEASLKDGIQSGDAIVLLQTLPRLKNIVTNAKTAFKELTDLTPDEASMLENRILAQTNLISDGRPVIVIARDAMHLAVRTYRITKDVQYLIRDWRDLVADVKS